MHPAFDVAVVGGGPVGCVAALAHARRGATVALLEAHPGPRHRFAGELLHPRAMDCLAEVGVHDLPPAQDHAANRGFAVMSPTRPSTFLLEYDGPADRKGATFPFDDLVETLRGHAIAHPRIHWMPHHRMTGLHGQQLDWIDHKAKRKGSLTASRIIGADGRFSAVRKALGLGSERTPLSAMVGVLVKDVTLPHEGYGHVMLGGAGPALAYRISENLVRLCLDVPLGWKSASDRAERLLADVVPRLPVGLQDAVATEIREDRLVWARNEACPKTSWGRPGAVLVGDAVGHCHPMTGIGMTLGFSDAVALARHDDVHEWVMERHAQTTGPSLLSTALYEILTLDAPGAVACREAIFDMWSADPSIRQRSVELLSCDEPRFSALMGVGMRMVGRAAWSGLRNGQPVRTAGELSGLVRWLLTRAAPGGLALPSVPSTPFAAARQAYAARLTGTVQPNHDLAA